MTTEVLPRHIEDRGGGLAYVDGRMRLVEGLAFPDEEIESRLSYYNSCLLYTSDAADERSSVDVGGRRIIKKKNIDRD